MPNWDTIKSRVVSWPALVAVLAIASTFLGIAAGAAQEPPNEESVTDVGSYKACPKFDTISSLITTTVWDEKNLAITSDLKVTLTGVAPPDPPLSDILQRPAGASSFGTCFIDTDTDIKTVSWSNGKLDIEFTLLWNDTTGLTKNMIKETYGVDHSTLVIDLCAPSGDPDRNEGAICDTRADNSVVIRVKRTIQTLVTKPFPSSQTTNGDYLDTTWKFDGPMPPLKVELGVPFDVAMTSWIENQKHHLPLPFTDSRADIALPYVASVWDIWLALLLGACILWVVPRGEAAHGKLRSGMALMLLVAAGFLLAVETPDFGYLAENTSIYIASGIVVIIAWWLLSAAGASRRLFVVSTVLLAAAIAPLIFLTVMPRDEDVRAIPLYIFCGAFVSLVVTAAGNVWGNAAVLFDMARLDRTTSTWHELYRRTFYCVVLVAFMFSIGFPVGEVVNRGGNPYPIAPWLAQQWIGSTGVLFRVAVAWASVLLLISFLARYALRLPSRVVQTTIAALLGFILCMSAPSIAKLAFVEIVAVPVWLVQFVVLWTAFYRLIESAGDPPIKSTPPLWKKYLLQDATGEQPKSAPTRFVDRVVAQFRGSETPNQAARSRLLVLGPTADRLTNAKDAAQIASIIAIIPVGYLVWTTVSKLGENLNTNTDILIVAVFATLEFARWVVTGFIFGYLYRELPGHVGPVKALAFAGIWVISCVGPLFIAEGLGQHVRDETIYRSAQFALFAIVLAVAYDLQTVNSAGGTWRNLRKVYDLQNYAEVAAAVAPAALLALTLAQQIAAGSGLDVADSLLSGIPNVLKGQL